ncbi:PAQR family membrane homeostasis protein TrhA [Aquibacillus salsiterrae]|uniref:Hemolysin III family protein n=1 Tax=Aquibacillus salsiterrae TaxID=2950439 RepID=A0A9X4AFT1_9BACI|nr:hemolysin III family protein [Aquibacillus salsiterrae]MDC3416545.1 hemolysin III family protein [Aquibacillus salsiterrae]
MTTHTFTRKEEIVHAVTHGIGALFSLTALVLLITFASLDGDFWHIFSATVFGLTMLLMYVSSTIAHGLKEGKWKDIFQIFDHAAIYLFIAGSYTPILLVPLRNEIGWTLLGIVWGIALVGIIFKIFFVEKFLILSTVFYVLMGWLIVFVWEPLSAAFPATGLLYLVVGGLLYTVGAVFYVWRKFHYHHAVWHLFVIAGSIFHFFTVFYYII